MRFRKLFVFIFLLPVALASGPDKSFTCYVDTALDSGRPVLAFDLQRGEIPYTDHVQLNLLDTRWSSFNTVNKILASPAPEDPTKGKVAKDSLGREFLVFDWLLGDYDAQFRLPKDLVDQGFSRSTAKLDIQAPPGSEAPFVAIPLKCISN